MTNSTINATINTTNQEVIAMDDMNKSQLVSTMTAELFKAGLTPISAMTVAAAFLGCADYMDDAELFAEFFIEGLEVTTVQVKEMEHTDTLDIGLVMTALVSANYLLETGELGPRLGELCMLRQEAYKPVLASEGVERRFNYVQKLRARAISPLFVEAVHALEATQYTKCAWMESIALQVQAQTGGEDKDDEGYVLKGCALMDEQAAYVSEFKGDTRGRIYQASCHGPNGQSSDRSRALMDLANVPTVYHVGTVKRVIMAEIKDMVPSGMVKECIAELKELGDVAFIIKHRAKSSGIKAWSFVKAAYYMRELQAGNTPYIGMAVGLDAKCSGPQLGALMVGDQKIAAACGMTMEQMDDAYKLAEYALEKAGFAGLTRSDVKKPYMGIFYGQGYMAFTIKAKNADDDKGVSEKVWISIYGSADAPANDDRAKRFHKAITSSFGAKMNAVRKLIKSYGKITVGKTRHNMPDGFEVSMNYMEQVNVFGEIMDFDTNKYDVTVRNNAEEYKFINFQLRTNKVHEGDFARNGFVNMIQATDALIARLIIVHLNRLGAQHIISVHDCFRVNVTEMHILERAIKSAYMDLFGAGKATVTEDMPLGTDILALYFTGANKQLVEGETHRMVAQFTSKGTRYMQKVNGHYVKTLICALGEGSYYFAK